MSKLTFDKVAWAKQVMACPADPVAVKLSKTAHSSVAAFGRVVEPPLYRGGFKNTAELYNVVLALRPVFEVVVIGHGWDDRRAEIFVWSGTPDEFVERWEGD